jgi:sialate O-acetylesterase
MRSFLPIARLAVVAFAVSLSAHAAVRLPAIFSDRLVLQQDTAVPVWGWADPGEEVTVSVAEASGKTKADAAGKWMVKLSGLKAGGPHTLTIAGPNTIAIQDVLIGEVWLGSGQSNMAMTVGRAKDFEQEQKAANFPQVRMFTEKSGAARTAQEGGAGTWVICSPESVAGFSATLFFTGREIHQALGVPVGLINSSVGGTPIESWIAPEVQRAAPELKPVFEAAAKADAAFDPVAAKAKFEKDKARWAEAAKKARAEGKPVPRAPRDPVALRERKSHIGGLFNGKIAPLIPYAIRGALWYQGEANSGPD